MLPWFICKYTNEKRTLLQEHLELALGSGALGPSAERACKARVSIPGLGDSKLGPVGQDACGASSLRGLLAAASLVVKMNKRHVSCSLNY